MRATEFTKLMERMLGGFAVKPVHVGEQEVDEDNVITPNFGRKSPYYKNPDIEVPMYDPKLGRAWNQAYSDNNPQEPFDSFEVEPAGKTASHIIGIKNGKRVRISTATGQLADVLVAAYNRGGFTDQQVQRVKFAPSREEPEAPKKKSHLRVVDEAIKIDAPQTKWSRDELQGYANRIKTGTKTKRDKYNPIIHASNIKGIEKEDGTEWDLDDLARQITTRPKAILGTNAKMEKSATEGEIIYDLTLPAISGIVVDEETGDFVEIKTCPGAGECQLFCYARKGGYVMFPASSMSAAQALNFLVNDPKGYMDRVNKEIATIKSRSDKHGIQLVVRWHDAGDFFSKEYLNLAFNVARANPEVKFYAYTKIADVATSSKPANFIINFSSGAQPSQEKKIEFHRQQTQQPVKAGITVPKDMFFDLIARQGNKLIKDAKGRTQFKDQQSLNTFKQRLAQQYQVDPKTIITYDQMLDIPPSDTPKWNVIVQPGAGDRGANRKDVINSFLMFH